MYVDFSIPVNPKLPDSVKEEIALLDKAFNDENEFEWDKYEEVVNVDLRDCFVGGIINDGELDAMMRRFGWR